MGRICVYCGSSKGNNSVYSETAIAMGEALARQQLDLVYGGGSIGIMRIIADAVLEAGGQVFGVIPQSLVDREVAHHELTELHVTSSMHERKSKMAELSDAFIALPGGLGTLEELFEIWTWTQLGFHQKPIAVLNTQGYYDSLLKFLDTAVSEGFVKPDHRNMLIVESDPEILISRINNYVAPLADKLSGAS